MNNILRDLHNSSILNNCFVKFLVLNKLTFWYTQNFGLFLGMVLGNEQIFFFLDSPQKVHTIHRAICFAYILAFLPFS